jgi:hypothetical protein
MVGRHIRLLPADLEVQNLNPLEFKFWLLPESCRWPPPPAGSLCVLPPLHSPCRGWYSVRPPVACRRLPRVPDTRPSSAAAACTELYYRCVLEFVQDR